MKHLNLLIATIYLVVFSFDIYFDYDMWTWLWFIVGLINLAEWVRYTITRDIKEYIDKKLG